MTISNINIPNGWKIKKISDLGNTISGGTPDTNKSEYWDGDVLWLTPSEVSTLESRFILNTERKITQKGLEKSSAKLLPINSLIICTRATIGDCCINKVPMCTNQGFKNIIVKNNNVEFLYYLITQNKNKLIRKACGSTFLEISKKDIDNLKFSIPPLPEQEKIAEILGTWDEAIEKLAKLIEAKKLQKKGLMQKLLTGVHRLNGFTKPWKEVKLGELYNHNKIVIEKGKPLTSEDVVKGNIPVIAGGKSIPYYHNNYTHNIPCITISASGAYAGYVWKHKKPIWASDCNVIYGLKDYDTSFLGYCLEYKQTYIYKLQTGGAQPHVYASDIKIITIPIIDYLEQKAIADILSVADEEIDLLNKKLEAFKKQKKGLMQQLLTGKIRVKVDKKGE